jgi:hypothetical protein
MKSFLAKLLLINNMHLLSHTLTKCIFLHWHCSSFVGNLLVNLHIFNYIVFHTSRKYGQEIAELCLHRVIIECKLYKESATIIALVQSGEMVHPCTEKVILLTKTVCLFYAFYKHYICLYFCSKNYL